MTKLFNIIFASTLNGGIGNDNKIPWNIKEELQYFKDITSNTNDTNKMNAVIMGRKTWNSLSNKPLKNRINIIISNSINDTNGSKNIYFFNNLDNAFTFCNFFNKLDKIFIIGGETLYNECIFNKKYNIYIDRIYLSLIKTNYICDKFINIKYILNNYYFDSKLIKFNENYISLIASNYKKY